MHHETFATPCLAHWLTVSQAKGTRYLKRCAGYRFFRVPEDNPKGNPPLEVGLKHASGIAVWYRVTHKLFSFPGFGPVGLS